jgi:DNA-binding CsgD family transcriptional regulator
VAGTATGAQPVIALAERFWAKGDRQAPEACWLWRGASKPSGYGTIGGGRPKKWHRAHRVAWALTYGAIPPGMCVCHHCDAPGCCNPAHLFLGSKADNTADMYRKGRQRGRAIPKLTPTQVRTLRHLHRDGISASSLARAAGVNVGTVSNLVRRLTWKHV